MTDLFSHHRRNLLPHRGRAHIIGADIGFTWDLPIAPRVSHSIVPRRYVFCTQFIWKWKGSLKEPQLPKILFGGLLISVHSLEESGNKYILDFSDLLYPQGKIPMAMSHEMSIFLSYMSCQHKIPLNLFWSII